MLLRNTTARGLQLQAWGSKKYDKNPCQRLLVPETSTSKLNTFPRWAHHRYKCLKKTTDTSQLHPKQYAYVASSWKICRWLSISSWSRLLRLTVKTQVFLLQHRRPEVAACGLGLWTQSGRHHTSQGAHGCLPVCYRKLRPSKNKQKRYHQRCTSCQATRYV